MLRPYRYVGRPLREVAPEGRPEIATAMAHVLDNNVQIPGGCCMAPLYGPGCCHSAYRRFRCG